VTHGFGVDGMARSLINDDDYFFEEVDYCSLTSLKMVENKYEIELAASVDHLKDMKIPSPSVIEDQGTITTLPATKQQNE
jgi:hypothetical protein